MAQMTIKSQSVPPMIEMMVNKLADGYRPQRIILFGSHAAGTATEESDIDLLIIKETDQRFIERWKTVRGLVRGMHPGVPLDTLILTPKELDKRLALRDDFVQDILDQGVELYAA